MESVSETQYPSQLVKARSVAERWGDAVLRPRRPQGGGSPAQGNPWETPGKRISNLDHKYIVCFDSIYILGNAMRAEGWVTSTAHNGNFSNNNI